MAQSGGIAVIASQLLLLLRAHAHPAAPHTATLLGPSTKVRHAALHSLHSSQGHAVSLALGVISSGYGCML
jgi:hypothetical protein